MTAVVVRDIDRYRRDAGISISSLAASSGIDQGYLSQVLMGQREPSIAVLNALATTLGGDLSIRVYPSTGPIVRDRIQARIVEALLRVAEPAWQASVEVAVHRPARGFVDVVFVDPRRELAVVTEVESRLDRIEQQVRWAGEKAQSLPSSDLWTFTGGVGSVSRLLVLRSTAATRETVRRFALTLATVYPARAADVHTALTTAGAPWPGAGILWADVRGDTVRILDRPPRGIPVGR